MTGIFPGWTTCMSACGRLAKTLGFTENPEVGAPRQEPCLVAMR